MMEAKEEIMMLNNRKAQQMVASMTRSAKTYKAWKEAVYRAVTLFGEEAIYYVDCDRLLKEGDEGVSALPYEEWVEGQRVHLGLEVQHSYDALEDGQLFTYSDAPILLW